MAHSTPDIDPIRHKAATTVFKLAAKTLEAGMHRTLNRPPKGKGWVPCATGPEGIMCRPEKVKEAIEYCKIAYEIHPDIVALNQIALGYEVIGDPESAVVYFRDMERQAEHEDNIAYLGAARAGITRCTRDQRGKEGS